MDTVETLSEVAEQVQAMAGQTMDKVSARAKKVRADVLDVRDSVVSFTQENPVTAIVVSAAVGALIAIMLRTLGAYRD
jgi:ElaB/YqjD/DUF883 family membrane-anchored ribosome-binding protein